MSLPVATALRNITYFFSDDATTDHIAVRVGTETQNLFTLAPMRVDQLIDVYLPSSGWTDDDVLAAVQAKLPQFTVEWANG